MSQHVFSWIAGFGWTLMPYAPFRMEKVPGRPRSIYVQHSAKQGARQATVTIHEDGTGYEFDLSPGTARPDEVVDVIRGAAYEHWAHGASHDHWRVETSIFNFRWPDGFALASLPSLKPPVFDLVGPDDARIWVQGPVPHDRLPPLEKMGGPGQAVEQIRQIEGGMLVDLAYVHDGQPWRMFQCVLDSPTDYTCIVSAQTPARWAAMVSTAVGEIARSIVPCPQPA